MWPAVCGADEHCRQAMAGEHKPDAVVDLLRRGETGPLWGMASSDLNATVLVWPAGRELAEDTNTELDVQLVVLEGGGGRCRRAPGTCPWAREHVDLRRRGQDLEAGGVRDPAELREPGERLESHIRHEERVLFAMIEQVSPTEELERLGAAFARVDAEHQ
jgi:hypothetical protein